MASDSVSWDAKWTSLCERLSGLLSLESVERDDVLSPTDHWLVLHLPRIRGSGTSCQVVLEAATELLVATEMARSSTTDHAKLLKAVLTSKMMMTPLREGAAPLWRFTRPSNGYLPMIHLLLDLSGLDITSGAVREPLSALLHATRVPPVRQIALGVRMGRCRLTTEDIATLDAILTGRPDKPDSLVSSVIGRLDVSDNGLTPESLEALATLLCNHTVRDLRLENVLGRAASIETVRAFRSMITSAFSSKSEQAVPLSVSLAGNSFTGVYFQVIADALLGATRPLRSLSLARTFAHSTHAVDRALIWRQLTRIFIAQDPRIHAYNTECEMDLSGNSAFQQDADIFQKTFIALIDAQIESVREALREGTPVWCRVVSGARNYSGPSYSESLTDVEAAAGLHRIVDASVDGWIQIAATDTSSPTFWIVAGAISELRLGDSRYLLHPRFTSLIIDDLRISDSRVIAHVLTPIGCHLRKLSLHIVFTAYARIVDFLQLCPNLTHLDLAGCRLYDLADLWEAIRVGSAHALQSLDLTGNLIGAQGAADFARTLQEVPQLRLRHVKLNQNHLGQAGLVHIMQLLQQNVTLEILELDAEIERDVDNAYAAQRRLVSQRHNGERLSDTPVPRDARLAFLHALAVLSRRYDDLHAMDTPVVSLILEFAASRVTRQLQWHI